jgi:hypothetical protein
MAFRVNQHVSLIQKVSQSYEERATDLDDGVETAAYRFVQGLSQQDDVSLIVLTGDAGHGKTHLCRRLLQSRGYSADQAIDLLKADTAGERSHSSVNGHHGRPLRIVKDLSEITPVSRAQEILVDLLQDSGSVAIVCANEGRLRDALSQSPTPGLELISAALRAGIDRGSTTVHPTVQVINLNYQSVSGGERPFVDVMMNKWAKDARRWKVCPSCDAEAWCPIRANQRRLGGGGAVPDDEAAQWRAGVTELVEVVERAGYVLTIRECLVLLAHLITGGLDCTGVAAKAASLQRNPPRALGNLFDVGRAELSRPVPVLERIKRFDPGFRAARVLDDRLQPLIDEQVVAEERNRPPPRSIKDRTRRSEQQLEGFRRARREDFFTFAATGLSRARRIGLLYYDAFLLAVDPDQRGSAEWRGVRDRLIAGLHVIQGIRPRSSSNLHLVDPAFAKGTGGAAIVAKRIPGPEVSIMGREAHWSDTAEEGNRVVDSVDWLERGVVVRFGADPDPHLDLNVLHFEFVMRAGGGVALRTFHGPEIRRTLAELALLVEGTYEDATAQIEILDGTRLRTIQLDVGGQIRVGEF